MTMLVRLNALLLTGHTFELNAIYSLLLAIIYAPIPLIISQVHDFFITDCPAGIPIVQCDGDPCSGAVCPSHRTAMCRADYCGACTAKWFVGDEQVICTGIYFTL